MQLADASGVPQNTLSRNLLITTMIRARCIQTFDLDVPRLGSSRSIFGTTIPRTVLCSSQCTVMDRESWSIHQAEDPEACGQPIVRRSAACEVRFLFRCLSRSSAK